jgi:hypothetical protein
MSGVLGLCIRPMLLSGVRMDIGMIEPLAMDGLYSASVDTDEGHSMAYREA